MKNGFEKLGRSICMESPPSGTPTRVFLRACAINNREWARGSNPACAPHTIGDKCLKINTLRLSLCAKVKPFGFTPMYAHVGTQASAWAVVRPPPSAPISERNCHSHTDSLLRPPVVPKCVRSRLLCAHNVCVVVPECQRVAYAVGHGRVHVRPR